MSTRRRLALALALPAVLLGGPLVGSASADVQTPAPTVAAGGSGSLSFAATADRAAPITRVDLALPVDAPLLDVSVPAVDGWTSTTTTSVTPSCGAKAVSHVTWTATGGGIAPEGTGSFALQVGRFPAAADQLTYEGSVTYADGTVVGWSRPGSTAAARPVPFLDLARSAATPTVAVSAEPSTRPAPATTPTAGWFTNLMTSIG